MTASLREPDSDRPLITTGEELADLLVDQHSELREAWGRVASLHDCAREDVFLHARRRLAVHVALEHVLLVPRLRDAEAAAELGAALDREVSAAEEAGPASPEFDAACSRVAEAFVRHSSTQERMVLTGVLPDHDREVVDTALALWDGTGDAYLGNTWAEMRATSVEQLSRE
jgi:hypothetical protein